MAITEKRNSRKSSTTWYTKAELRQFHTCIYDKFSLLIFRWPFVDDFAYHLDQALEPPSTSLRFISVCHSQNRRCVLLLYTF